MVTTKIDIDATDTVLMEKEKKARLVAWAVAFENTSKMHVEDFVRSMMKTLQLLQQYDAGWTDSSNLVTSMRARRAAADQ